MADVANILGRSVTTRVPHLLVITHLIHQRRCWLDRLEVGDDLLEKEPCQVLEHDCQRSAVVVLFQKALRAGCKGDVSRDATFREAGTNLENCG